MKEMKNDAEFRKDLLQIVRESNDCFSNSVKEISKSMSDLSKGLCASVELLSRAKASQPLPQFLQAPFHPNVIFQNLNRHSPKFLNSKDTMHRCQVRPAAVKVKTQKFNGKTFMERHLNIYCEAYNNKEN